MEQLAIDGIGQQLATLADRIKKTTPELQSISDEQHEPPVCDKCFGEGIDGEPGDEPGTGHTWKCTKCNGTGHAV